MSIINNSIAINAQPIVKEAVCTIESLQAFRISMGIVVPEPIVKEAVCTIESLRSFRASLYA